MLASPLHAAERRVALVIGNSSYTDKPLRNPANDAADLAAALKRMGFEVMERKNRTADQLRGDLSDFQDKLSPGAVGLFYFAGHGVQAGRGQNYLLPVGVTYKRERDAEAYGLEVGSVLRRMEDSGAALSLVILDACRDSPLPPEGRSTASRGLGRMEAPSGSMIAFATAPGSIADDNASGRNGLYTQHLLAAIEAPGVRLEDVFKRVRRGVEKDSNRRQSPEEIMKLTSDEPFYFRAGNAVQVASIKPEPVTPTARPRQASGLSLEDLQKEEETRQAWIKWQGQMKADFDKTAVFAGSADLQVKAWERFLAAWVQDNPLSREDDDLRSQATTRQLQALAAVPVAAPAVAQGQPATSASASTANSASMGAGQVFKDCADCPEMVVIPAGSFQMGSNDYDSEKPIHSVNIKSFALGKYEVTQGQWKAVMGSNPSNFSNCGDNCPVEQVNWNDIQQYIQKLNQKTGQQYRLPSEAEWEYAARAVSTTKYRWGNDIGLNNASCDGCGSQWDKKSTAPAGQFKPNGFGLYDMHGNVWEWVQDGYHNNYSGAPTDGSAWETGGTQDERVLRGGSWIGGPVGLRSAYRFRNSPDDRINLVGFRLARTAP